MPIGVYKRSKEQLIKLKELSNKPRSLRNGGYHAIHKWLSKHYGKANKCDNPFCEKPSLPYHWAKLKGKEYEHKRENFINLCALCHRRYDHTIERGIKSGKSLLGKKHTKKHNKKISNSCKGIHQGNKHSAKKIIQISLSGDIIKTWDCINDAAVKLNISPSGITMCARGQLKKSGGFRWGYLSNA